MVAVAIITMGCIALFFSIVLVIADKKLKVVINPKIEAINEILPQANCGACGYPGCMGYATAVVEKDVEVNRCAPGGSAVTEEIALILGKESQAAEKKVAMVHCRGDEQACQRKGFYQGIKTCRAAQLVTAGDKVCNWGCLGYGDCQRVCPFDAIRIAANGLPQVDENKCTGCGLCVKECPRQILELHPVAQKALVYCRSHDNPIKSRQVCRNACIGCSICVRGCSSGAIVMDNNLAVIVAPEKLSEDCLQAMAKCPTKAIAPR